MTPKKALITIISLFLVLGLMAIIFPSDGIHISESLTLRFPSLSEVFPVADTTANGKNDPEDEIRAMMEATRQKQFAAFADSLRFYQDFFDSGKTRFDLPNNDPTWFDRFFLHLQLASIDSSVVHIVHYGDSQLEEDRISSTIREDLQEEFGGAGPGMLPPVLKIQPQTTVHWSRGALERYILFGPKDEEATHSRYGPLAQFANLNGTAVIGIKRRLDRKDRTKVYPHAGGYATIKVLAGKRGKLKVRMDYDRTFTTVVGLNPDSTEKIKTSVKMVEAEPPIVDSSYTKLNVYTWKLPDTTSSVKITLTGNTEIYAVSADGAYGVAVDNVAMRGSSGTIFHRIDPELLAESYKAMNAKLIMMEYGGNMVPSISTSNIDYIKKLVTRQILAIQKANPDADIIFIGPADMERQSDGRWKTYPALRMTINALREVALENGVAYWDMHRVMGGNGTMSKWVKREPPLGFTDHIHFTRRGATHMGDLFCSSLRMYYDFFKFRGRHNISDKKLRDLRNFNDSVGTKKIATAPTAKKPVAEPVKKPVTDPTQQVRKPVAEQPVRKPIAEQPVRKPAAEQPARKPAAEQPVRKPTAEQPVRKPVAEQPVRKPTAEQPAKKTTVRKKRQKRDDTQIKRRKQDINRTQRTPTTTGDQPKRKVRRKKLDDKQKSESGTTLSKKQPTTSTTRREKR
ncbi:GDSL-type esterase/lipase family protein [uncultured Fibrobacter sp.]|uniref:GDSL-type esterase/lipase family protein n=1 Tax=uncultured Fibrobacter sp. TaxID=261512 RepID=UPI0025E0D497|nr:GDSL-type esterase/lipase family protein [uncultured Fibrobacter sp.]